MGTPEVGRQLADASHGLGGTLPGVGKPEGLRRRAGGDLLRLGEVGGDHSGAPPAMARRYGRPRAEPPPARRFRQGRETPEPAGGGGAARPYACTS